MVLCFVKKGALSIVKRRGNGEGCIYKRKDGRWECRYVVVKDENGNPLKEWDAIADYLYEMDGEIDEKYAEVDGRKVVYASWNPADLLRNANLFTYAVVAVILVVIALLISVVAIVAAAVAVPVVIVGKKKKKKLLSEAK